MNLKCLLGIHDWYYQFPVRYCLHCHKYERATESTTACNYHDVKRLRS